MSHNKITPVTAEQTNSTASITISCNPNEAVYITHISAVYDDTLTATTRILTILDQDNNVLWRYYIHNGELIVNLDQSPLKGPVEDDITINLQNSGDAGVNGRLNIMYFKGE